MESIKIPVKILFVLLSVPLYYACSSGAETYYEALPAENVSACMVAPDVIEVTITDGYVEYGTQNAYVKQDGDSISDFGLQQTAVYRKGKLAGWLGGKDRDIFLNTDKVVKRGIPVKKLMDAKSWELDIAGAGSVRHPVRVYRKSRPTDLARIGPWNFDRPEQHVFYLQLGKALESGKTYLLKSVNGLVAGMEIICDSLETSSAIHIAQTGFRPDDPVKKAFLSC